VPKYLVYALLWAFSGDGKMKSRVQMGEFIRSVTTIPLPSSVIPIIDNEVRDTLAIITAQTGTHSANDGSTQNGNYDTRVLPPMWSN